MPAFLEKSISVDATGVIFGNTDETAKVSVGLTLDKRSNDSGNFTVNVPINDGDTLPPYSATLIAVPDSSECVLTFTFDRPANIVRFNYVRTLRIMRGGNETTLDVEINHADKFIIANWQNANNTNTIDDIDLRASLTSRIVNDRILGVFRVAKTALNRAVENARLYSFKRKSLPDIIDFALGIGACPTPGIAEIVRNANNDVEKVVIEYTSDERGPFKRVAINYVYSDYNVTSVVKHGGPATNMLLKTTPLLNSININLLDSENKVAVELGSITIHRAEKEIAIDGLPDYNAALPPEEININPDNIISDFKYYKISVITGWTVKA